MRDGESTCTPVGSGAVDEQFWALICEDEEWLDSEFDQSSANPRNRPECRRGRECVPAGPVPPGRVRALAATGLDTRPSPGTVP